MVELLVVVAVIAILAGILLPTLERSRVRAQSIFCLNNTKQLTLAWIMYADEHNGELAYNLGSSGMGMSWGGGKPPPPMRLNWVNNVLDWTKENSDNTNAPKMVDSGLGPYVSKTATVYRCPSDHSLSSDQRGVGWSARVRSYSMNAMIGNAGGFSQSGWNVNNPDYIQFFRLTSIPQPADIFVFLDEHPDSIDDGYFVNKAYNYEWTDLPASYHDGGACFSFVDGHSETHRWRAATTIAPPLPGAARLPKKVSTPPELADFYWVISRMSVEQNLGDTTSAD